MRRITCHLCVSFIGTIEKGSSLKKGVVILCYKCFNGFDGPGDGNDKTSMPEFMQTFFKGFGNAGKA